MTDEQAISRALAGFAAALRIDDLPEDVVHQAVRCLVDWLGCTVAGSATALNDVIKAAYDAGIPFVTAAATDRTSSGCGRSPAPPSPWPGSTTRSPASPGSAGSTHRPGSAGTGTPARWSHLHLDGDGKAAAHAE